MDVFGPISLSLQLFKGCLAAFSLVVDAKIFGPDAAVFRCMLKLDEFRLRTWAQNAGILDGRLDERLNEALINETLSTIRTLLSDVTVLKTRYGLEYVPSDTIDSASSGTAEARPDTMPAELGFLDAPKILRVQDSILENQKLPGARGLIKRIRWASLDKDRFVNLARDIGTLIQKLEGLLDSANQRAIARDMSLLHCELVNTIRNISALGPLRVAASALYGDNSIVSSIAVGRGIVLESESTGNQTSGPASLNSLGLLLSPDQERTIRVVRTNGNRGLGVFNGQRVYLEFKEYEPKDVAASWLQTRAKSLSAFLGSDCPECFHSLRCLGYFNDIQKSRYCFLYRYPATTQGTPSTSTLQDLLQNNSIIPSLTTRFSLAVELANTVLYLHSAGWLHKNLRSENIVFFLPTPDLPTLSFPYVMGYQLARIDCNNEITEQAPNNREADMYRHPETLGETRRSRFRGRFDVYSLGMVLLELAYWYPLSRIFNGVIDLANCSNYQLRRLQDVVLSEGSGILAQVKFRMGDTYCEVAKACISGSFSSQDSTETDLDDREELAAFFRSIVQKLETCKV
ncbi:uncharacterized protein K441DRAFT_673186 [Cenococcum geophilum 1.58]|uniref:uncharacterized protein n=1 Tax=Cenococcum geophilum 1.58 TaxID=794803 RepID=UPI00358E1A03|nr:hypothetical protein K441DRAFT_673186 [Cenococcum geophilum 1.58]